MTGSNLGAAMLVLSLIFWMDKYWYVKNQPFFSQLFILFLKFFSLISWCLLIIVEMQKIWNITGCSRNSKIFGRVLIWESGMFYSDFFSLAAIDFLTKSFIKIGPQSPRKLALKSMIWWLKFLLQLINLQLLKQDDHNTYVPEWKEIFS